MTGFTNHLGHISAAPYEEVAGVKIKIDKARLGTLLNEMEDLDVVKFPSLHDLYSILKTQQRLIYEIRRSDP